jgi:PhoPQ-activated pathogenicity-related protein
MASSGYRQTMVNNRFRQVFSGELTLILLVLFMLSCSRTAVITKTAVTPETALQAYLQNSDNSFKWEVQDKFKAEGVTLYRVLFTSQQWRGINWNHEMTIMVPDILKFNDALLFITGGSVKNEIPNTHKWDEELTTSLSQIAKTNMAIAAIVWQIPNQPLYDDLTEDALISYTLYNYLNDHDFTWPLLFPMTKSAIRAMDVVQNFAKTKLNNKVNHFIVSGASKRGWTTWLTGANDKRVTAIGPMVIDVLNMPVNVDYQKTVWGDYSIEIEDYVKLGIAQQLSTPGGNELVKMIDPYSYRQSLTMPKMIFMGTNDPYWPVDAVKNYIDSIPGSNQICYTPNAGHDLGDKRTAFAGLNALVGSVVTKTGLPTFSYTASESYGTVTVKIKSSPERPVDAALWSADSKDQDFRDEKWAVRNISLTDKAEIAVEIELPDSGFRAFYVDMKYKAPFGDDFTQSTRMFVINDQKLLLSR